MKKQVSYICDTCGAAYDTEAECAACESKHVKLETATMLYMRGGAMPAAILIKGGNGTVTRYNWYQSEEADDAPIADNEHAGEPIKLTRDISTVAHIVSAPYLPGLKNAIQRAYTTQRELSEKTGIPQSTLSSWGLHPASRKIQPDRLPALAAALDCTVADLLTAPKEG